MSSITISPLPHPITASIELPGSLSYTIRALMLASMTKGPVKLINPVKSDDSLAMITILKTLGIAITEGENFIIVHDSIKKIVDKHYTLDVHISGRTAR